MRHSLFWLAATAAGCAASYAHGADDSTANSTKDRIDSVIVSAPLHKTAAETALPVVSAPHSIAVPVSPMHRLAPV